MKNLTWLEETSSLQVQVNRWTLTLLDFPTTNVVGVSFDRNARAGIYLHVIGSHSEINAIMANVVGAKKWQPGIQECIVDGDYYNSDFELLNRHTHFPAWNARDVGGYSTKRVGYSSVKASLYVWADSYFKSPKRKSFVLTSSQKGVSFHRTPIESWDWSDFGNAVFRVATLPQGMFMRDGLYDPEKMQKIYLALRDGDALLDVNSISSYGAFHNGSELNPFVIRRLTAGHAQLDQILASVAR